MTRHQKEHGGKGLKTCGGVGLVGFQPNTRWEGFKDMIIG